MEWPTDIRTGTVAILEDIEREDRRTVRKRRENSTGEPLLFDSTNDEDKRHVRSSPFERSANITLNPSDDFNESINICNEKEKENVRRRRSVLLFLHRDDSEHSHMISPMEWKGRFSHVYHIAMHQHISQSKWVEDIDGYLTASPIQQIVSQRFTVAQCYYG